MLLSLQAMRGFAAIAVVFYHVHLILSQKPYGSHQIYASVAPHGLLGVNFFFVLSGFIILMAHEKDIGRIKSIPAYLYRRFIRVYPTYWIYMTGYIAAALIGLGYPDFSFEPSQMASSYLLVYLTPTHDGLPLKVAWTLFHEIKFYLMFTAFLINRKLGLTLFALWVCSMGYAYFYQYEDMNKLISIWNINFIAGMAAYWLYKRLPQGLFPITLGAGLILLFLTLGTLDNGLHAYKEALEKSIPYTAMAFMLILLGVAQAEQKLGLKIPRALGFLGDASYSIYLVHSAVVSAVLLIATKLKLVQAIGLPAVFWGTFIIAITSSCIAYIIVERSTLRFLRQHGPKNNSSIHKPSL